MRFVAFNHHGKGTKYIKALEEYHERLPWKTKEHVDFVLADNDLRGRRRDLTKFYENGAGWFFIYPHAGRPNLGNDIRAAWRHTTCQFVATKSHKEVMRLYGYQKNVYVTGWTLCEQKPFEATAGKDVLFAPIHHRCAEIDKEANRKTFEILVGLAKQNRINLKVRSINELRLSGLEEVRHQNIEYTIGSISLSNGQLIDIDAADIVIAHQTFAYMAVARGKPTVMMAEDMPSHIFSKARDPIYARNWDKYHHLIAYPYDILDTDDAWELLQKATNKECTAWRRRMIGKDFEEDKFVNIVNTYLENGNTMAKRESKYQGKRFKVRGGQRVQLNEPIYYIVNPGGAIHDCSKEHCKNRLKNTKYRLATDSEIEQYMEAGSQDFTKPIAPPPELEEVFIPTVPDPQAMPDAVNITNAAAELAKEHGIDVTKITEPSGADGAILVKDVKEMI